MYISANLSYLIIRRAVYKVISVPLFYLLLTLVITGDLLNCEVMFAFS